MSNELALAHCAGQATAQGKEPRKPKDLGPLNALLHKGLPDFHHENGMLDTHKLASALGVSYQALYKVYSRNRIPSKRIGAIIDLSEGSVKQPDGFEPLTYKAFKDFM